MVTTTFPIIIGGGSDSGMTRSPLPLLALSAALSGCATADYGQLADSATTAVALSNGYSEANPLLDGMSWPWIAVTKLAVTQVVKLTPLEICEPGLTGLALGGFGAAIWNIGVMAGSGPAAIPIILVGGWFLFDPAVANSKQTCADPWAFWREVIE